MRDARNYLLNQNYLSFGEVRARERDHVDAKRKVVGPALAAALVVGSRNGLSKAAAGLLSGRAAPLSGFIIMSLPFRFYPVACYHLVISPTLRVG